MKAFTKYEIFYLDLEGAKRQAAEKVSGVEDTPPLNLDSCVIFLPGWREDKINEWGELVYRHSDAGNFFVRGNLGRGRRNTEYQEWLASYLTSMGYSAHVYYKLD